MNLADLDPDEIPPQVLLVCGISDGRGKRHGHPLVRVGLIGGEILGGVQFGGFNEETWVLTKCEKHSTLYETTAELKAAILAGQTVVNLTKRPPIALLRMMTFGLAADP